MNFAADGFARRVHVAANFEKERNVPDVVKAEGDQRSFHDAVDEEGEPRILVGCVRRERVDAPADRRPDVAQNEGKPDGREGGDDRDEALAGEKAEVLRQADLVVANEERAGDETDCNAAENAGVDRGDSHDRLGLGAVQPGDDAHGA